METEIKKIKIDESIKEIINNISLDDDNIRKITVDDNIFNRKNIDVQYNDKYICDDFILTKSKMLNIDGKINYNYLNNYLNEYVTTYKMKKGKLYEYYILNYLLNKNKKCWLWKNIPLIELLNSNIITYAQYINYGKYKYKNNNPVLDIGADILLKENNNYIFIQCKNHFQSISHHDLSAFYMLMTIHSDKKGIVYYTSSLNRTLSIYATRSKNIRYEKHNIIL